MLKKEPLTKVRQKKIPVKKGSKPDIPVERNRYAGVTGLAIIILLGFIIYSNSFNCSFHLDDFHNIVDNTNIRNLSDVKAWWNVYPTRPFAVFTYVLNYHFNQLDVRYWHLVNLVIHLINASLVWWLTLLIFSSPAMKDQKIVRHKNMIAFLTALLFVSHPLATQSVTYIVQRMASMVALFYFLSLILYIKARLGNNGNLSKYLLFAGSLISGILAMLTKENAFTLPLAIILFEFFFIRTKKFSINFKDYRVILLMAALLGVLLIIPLNYSFSIFNPIPPSKGHAYTLTPFNYLLTQFSVIVKYIQLLFLPVNQIVDYNFPISNNFFEIRTLLCFLVLLFLILLAIYLFIRNRIISFGLSWFFLTLLIESSFIPINDVIFEHRTYLPSFGFFLVLSSGIYALFGEKYKFGPIAILAIIIGSNSYLTYERNKVWKDEITLWSDNISKDPGCARPLYNRGRAYGVLHEPDKAIADYSRAIKIDPNFADPYYGRGIAFGNFKLWDKAIADYTSAIGINPTYTDAYYNRGQAYGELQQWEKAIADYSKTIGINPNYANAYYNRGNAYEATRQWDKAIADYSGMIGIVPNFATAYYNRGIAFGYLKEWEKAITDYSSAINIEPNYKEAFVNRGVAYGNMEQWNKALDDFTSALRIDPNYTIADNYREISSRYLKSMKGQ